MPSGSLISGAMRDAVGRELARRVSYRVSESDIRRWAVAVYYPQEPPARFWDDVAAKATRWGGVVAPEDFNPFAWMTAQPRGARRSDDVDHPDHTERQIGIAGPGLSNQLNGGVSAEYGEPMRPGDVITSVNRLVDYFEREGRLGLMLFTILEDTWTNQRNQLVKRTRITLIRY
jgi:N-terminal half of MaoC dehydratase